MLLGLVFMKTKNKKKSASQWTEVVALQHLRERLKAFILTSKVIFLVFTHEDLSYKLILYMSFFF